MAVHIAFKIAMNLQISLLALALAEGITLTKKAGFDPEKFLEVAKLDIFQDRHERKQGAQDDKG